MAELLTDVQRDLSELVYKFSLNRSLDFTDFIKTWNEMKFYYIYCGRTTVSEMKFFTQSILIMAKKFFFEDINDWHKVGAIFLMHSLYYSQPLEKHINIRIELQEFKQIMAYVKEMSVKSVDVAFAFYRLFLDSAFYFVATTTPHPIEKTGRVDLSKNLTSSETNENKLEKQKIINFLKEGGLDEESWRESESRYNEAMKQLADLNLDCNEIDFTPHDFFKELILPQYASPVSGGTKSAKRSRSRRNTVEKLVLKGGEPEDEPEPTNSGSSLPFIDRDFEES